MVLPVAVWDTVRSRAPLIEASVLETKFPPAVMLFLIWKSWACMARAMVSKARTPERRRNNRVGIVSTFLRKDIGMYTLQASGPTVKFVKTRPDRRLAVTPAECLPWSNRRNKQGYLGHAK